MTAHYLHATWADRPAMFRRLAAAVAPGGTLLVVGHLLGEDDGTATGTGTATRRGAPAHDPRRSTPPRTSRRLLDPGEWTDVVTETRDRDPEAADRTGNPVAGHRAGGAPRQVRSGVGPGRRGRR